MDRVDTEDYSDEVSELSGLILEAQLLNGPIFRLFYRFASERTRYVYDECRSGKDPFCTDLNRTDTEDYSDEVSELSGLILDAQLLNGPIFRLFYIFASERIRYVYDESRSKKDSFCTDLDRTDTEDYSDKVSELSGLILYAQLLNGPTFRLLYIFASEMNSVRL